MWKIPWANCLGSLNITVLLPLWGNGVSGMGTLESCNLPHLLLWGQILGVSNVMSKANYRPKLMSEGILPQSINRFCWIG